MDHVGILAEAFYLPPDKKRVEDVFRDGNDFNGDISRWDTSAVTTFYYVTANNYK